MAHGLDIVSIGVEDVSGVVVLVVARPKPGSAIVRATGAQRRRVEGINCRPVRRGEGQVQRCGRLTLPDEEVDPARRSPADAAPSLNLLNSERRERLTVEAPARPQVTNRNGEMIDEDLGF